jgi:hypothetical protein
MVRVGRILLIDEYEVINVSPARISKIMSKCGNDIPEYTALEIRDQCHLKCGEIWGGGIKVEWQQDQCRPYRSVQHYDFTFSRILRSEDYMKPDAPNEPIRT